MVLFDVPFSLLAGGLIGWRSRGTRPDLAGLYGVLGVAAPGAVFLERYPAWDWQYLIDPATVPAGAVGAFVLVTTLAELAGHELGHRLPRALPALGLALGVFLIATIERTLHVGSYAEWQAGTAPLLPVGFLATCALLMGPSALLFVWCVSRASDQGPADPERERG